MIEAEENHHRVGGAGWLAGLLDERVRIGDGFVELSLADAALADQAAAALRAEGIACRRLPTGLVVDDPLALRRLLRLLPLPTANRHDATRAARPSAR